jgi:ribosome-associated protein
VTAPALSGDVSPERDPDMVAKETLELLTSELNLEATARRETALNLAREIARAADSKKAEDIVILDVSRTLGITDYFVICSARAKTQVEVVAETCELVADKLGYWTKPLDGKDSGWVVGDYVDVILHVFEEERRKFYDLEQLWADAPRVDWTPEPRAAATP